jgi:hypothetical protein
MGAIKTVVTDVDKMGRKNVRYGTMTLSGSYATGGDSFSLADLQLETLNLLIVQPVKGGRIYEWDGGLKIKATLPTKAQAVAATGANALTVGTTVSSVSGAPAIGSLAVSGAPAIGSLAVSGAPDQGSLALVAGATHQGTSGTAGISGAPALGTLAVSGSPAIGTLAVSGAPDVGTLTAALTSGALTIPAAFRSVVAAGVGDEVTAAVDLSAVVLGYMAFGA